MVSLKGRIAFNRALSQRNQRRWMSSESALRCVALQEGGGFFVFLGWAFSLAPSFDCFMRRGDQEAIILSSLGYHDGRNTPEHFKNIRTCKKKKKKLETLYSDKQAKDFAVIVQSYSLFNSFGRWIVIISLHISGRINTFKPCIVLTPHKLRNFEHIEWMTKTLYFRIIIKSTNCEKCFERLIEQRRDSNSNIAE